MKTIFTAILSFFACSAYAQGSLTKEASGAELAQGLMSVPAIGLYCSSYSSSTVSGYSLYRSSDNHDVGNAVWQGDSQECGLAAQWANYLQNGIFCARYYNKNNGTTAYSIYRSYDNVDLGKATIADFNTCIQASQSLRNDIFCSTYVLNGETKWSMYDVNTGNDLGANVYGSLEACQQNY